MRLESTGGCHSPIAMLTTYHWHRMTKSNKLHNIHIPWPQVNINQDPQRERNEIGFLECFYLLLDIGGLHGP